MSEIKPALTAEEFKKERARALGEAFEAGCRATMEVFNIKAPEDFEWEK